MKSIRKIVGSLLLIALLIVATQTTVLAYEKESIDSETEVNYNQEIDFEDFFINAEIVDYDLSGVSFQLKEVGPIQNISTTVKVLPKDTEQALEFIDEAIAEENAKSGSNYRYKWDGSTIAKLWTTIYFTDVVYNGKDYIEIDKVKGGIYSSVCSTGAYVGDHTYIVDNDLDFGQSGVTTGGGYRSQYKVNNYSNTVRSFTTYPYSSWLPVSNVSISDVGAHYDVELKRGTSSWSVYLTNNIV